MASNSPDYPVGRLVVGRTGWQDYAVASASAPMRATADLEGFIVLDHLNRAPEVLAQLAEWMAQHKLTAPETVVEGFEQLPVAINMVFDDQNTGKLVVKL